GAGLQEAAFYLRDQKVSQKGNWIKWLVWIPWMAVIVLGFVSAGGVQRVNVFHNMDSFVSVTDPMNYIVYYFVVGLIFTLSLAVGNRAFCHYGCWMAPFMILGRKLRNLGRWPALQLKSSPEQCIDCRSCVRNCPMSLDVNALVHAPNMENSECILCGNCVDTCNKGVIRYSL
ncbi:MAG: 4Fe-4S ferredoxin, partial [Anaerolineae bacterium]|nr:4Fe-4S ferredoxin [Anaerolineae bacterium]